MPSEQEPAPSSGPRKPTGCGIAVLIAFGVVCVLLVILLVWAIRTSKRIGDERANEVAPFLRHVSFERSLRNKERFEGAVYVADTDGRSIQTRTERPFLIRDARTLAVCKTTRTYLGQFKEEKSGSLRAIYAYRIMVEVCLIDLKNPARRRVVTVDSVPPNRIQSEKQYLEYAVQTFDDAPAPARCLHDEIELIEAVLKFVGAQ